MMRIMRRKGAVTTVRSGKRARGFTLVEIMVGVTVLLIAMAGLVPLFLAGLSQSNSVRYKSTAANIAQQKIEEIRQLDYREIIDIPFLEGRFGKSESVRGVAYEIEYGLVETAYGEGILKEVSVEVGWTEGPTESPTRLTTLFHQQYVGPRISSMEVSDPPPSTDLTGGTPFEVLQENGPHTIYCHVAEADWGLVIDNLNQPGMAARDGVYLRLAVVDDNTVALQLGDPDANYEIEGLQWRTEEGVVTGVWIPYTINSADLPDGYWEFRGVIYNQYDEPGNVWRLRLRVENGSPEAPVSFLAVPQFGDESIMLYWSGGSERDRARYCIQRRDKPGADWKSWADLDMYVDPDATSYLDQGSIGLALDPWGTVSFPHYYQYRIWAVDNDGNSGFDDGDLSYSAEVLIPPSVPITTTTTLATTTTSSSTTTTLVAAVYDVTIVNNDNKVYDVLIEPGDPAEDDIDFEINKNATVVMQDLPAGSYDITATTPGRTPVSASFLLGPAFDPDIPVLTINK